MAAKAPTNLRWTRSLLASPATSKAKLVGVVCALQYMDWKTLGNVRPGVPRLSKETGLSPSTVQRALNELVERRFLAVAHRGGAGWATLYRGTFPHDA